MISRAENRKPELLSPAGNAEALRAAVQNGADAVYLGLSSFSARARAENFTLDTLKEALDYAHLRGVTVHIALNTLLKEEETEQAAEMALAADRMGADAFIVQDLGLATLLCGKLRAALHASTQLTVYNIEGMKELQALGFTRAVLARELPLEEIAKIAQAGLMETEVFCHGALCMAYSGQCMLSCFTAGGRSGNRGDCAQPCRLKYAYGEEPFQARLSPADLCSLSYLKELMQTGVSSLKIEGRLKSAEYTAAVTAAYRKAIDAPDAPVQSDIDALTVIFSRGGFSSGHQRGKMPVSSVTLSGAGKTGLPAGQATGKARRIPAPVSVYEIAVTPSRPLARGDGIAFYGAENREKKPGGVISKILRNGAAADALPAGASALLTVTGAPPVFSRNAAAPDDTGRTFYKTLDAAFFASLRAGFQPGTERKKIPLTGHLVLADGEAAVLTLTDPEGRSVTACSEEPVRQASGSGISEKDAAEKLSALGGTPFVLEKFTWENAGGLFIGFPALKKLRRDAIKQLTEKRTEGSRE